MGFAWNVIFFSFVREREGYKHHADCTVLASFGQNIIISLFEHGLIVSLFEQDRIITSLVRARFCYNFRSSQILFLLFL